jgi:hypothetical protein
MAGMALLMASLFAWQGSGRTLTLRGKVDGTLDIDEGRGWMPVEVFSARFMLPGVTLVSCSMSGNVGRHWLLLADSLSDEDFRRLRVWLKWSGGRHADNTKRPREAAKAAGS